LSSRNLRLVIGQNSESPATLRCDWSRPKKKAIWLHDVDCPSSVNVELFFIPRGRSVQYTTYLIIWLSVYFDLIIKLIYTEWLLCAFDVLSGVKLRLILIIHINYSLYSISYRYYYFTLYS